MKPIITLSLVAIITVTSLSFTFNSHNPGRKYTGSPEGFAVVELFTSEGCSSCPPADEVMIKLAKEFPGKVYFLGYHVDYWNYIGWKDEFSNAGYTERQRKYAEIFGLNSIYTPQVIVNGKKEFVGSKENPLRATIQQALKNPATSSMQLGVKKTGESIVTVSWRANNAGKADLHIALLQLKAVTNVKRGENSGRKLEHINIVRELRTMSINNETGGTVDLTLPSGLTAKDVKLIAFIQDKNNLTITGASEALIKE